MKLNDNVKQALKDFCEDAEKNFFKKFRQSFIVDKKDWKQLKKKWGIE